ncbi:MAG: hypothetical protein BRC33_03465 [Cyanobacteria bacterium SW_9_44_58]|nr:MAG: hypothetical protein BRC33_03465 [Cyanobacteria bacterium SW_9_44_58]
MTNTLILDGSNQQLRVGFNAQIQGTAGQESILVEDGADVAFTPQNGDRVDLAQNLANYTIQRTGLTQLTLTDNDGGETITLVVNQGQQFQLRFADGDTTVNFNSNGVIVGSETLASQGDEADTANISLGNDLSEVSPAINFTLTESANVVNEGDTLTFTVQADRNVQQDTQVNFDLSNSEIDVDDISGSSLTGTATIAAGSDTATFSLDLVEDNIAEPSENIIATATVNGNTLTADAIVNDATTSGPNTITLTDGTDAGGQFNGTPQNDQFVGNQNSLNGSDQLNGSGDEDILRITNDGSAKSFSGFELSNIERVIATSDGSGATSFDLSNSTGIEEVESRNSSQDTNFNQLTSLAGIVVTDLTAPGGTGTEPNVIVQYQDSVVANSNTATSLTVNDSQASTIRIGSVSDNNAGIEELTLEAEGDNTTITTLDSDIATLIFQGDQDVLIANPLNNTLREIQGSNAQGNLTVTLNAGGTPQAENITLGSGDDNITFDSNLGSQDTVNLGQGRDILESNQTGIEGVFGAGGVSNTEIVEIVDRLGQETTPPDDLPADDLISVGVDTIQLQDGFDDGVTINSLFANVPNNTASLRLDLEAASSGNTLNLDDSGFSSLSSQPEVTIGIGDETDSDLNAGIVDFNSDAVTPLTLFSNGTGSGSANDLRLFNAGLESIDIDGPQSLNLLVNWQQGAATSLAEINGEDAEGDLDLSKIRFDGSVNGVSVTGGSGDDILSGGDYRDPTQTPPEVDLDGNDTLIGGDGNDVLFGGSGADTLTGGNGQDVFVVRQQSESSDAQKDTITDFESGSDSLNIAELLNNAPPGVTNFAYQGERNGFGAAQGAVGNGTGTLEAVLDTDTNTLFFDFNDDGTLNQNDAAIILENVSDLEAADFKAGMANSTFGANLPQVPPAPGTAPTGNNLITTGSSFNTINGFNIQGDTKTTPQDDTIEVPDNAHLNNSNLDGQGGVDTVNFTEGTDYDLGTISTIAGFGTAGAVLNLTGGSNLIGNEAQLNSFAAINGNGGILKPQGDVDIVGNVNAGKTTATGFSTIQFDGVTVGQNIQVNFQELPSNEIDFRVGNQEFTVSPGGSALVDFTTSNITLTDFGANGTDTIDLRTNGTLRIDGSNTGNFANSSSIDLDGSINAILETAGNLNINQFNNVTNFQTLTSVGNGVNITDSTGNARTIRGDSGNNTIDVQAATAQKTIDITQGGDDVIDTAATTATGRVTIQGFDAGVGVGQDKFIFNGAATDLDGTNNFGGTSSIEDLGSGDVTLAAATEVGFITNNKLNDLSSPTPDDLDGTNLLSAQGGTITANSGQNHNLFAVEDLSGNVGIYQGSEAASDADMEFSASEISLIGVLEDTNLNDLTLQNFGDA